MKKAKGLLPGGRHVATINDDELRHIRARLAGLLDADDAVAAIDEELGLRTARVPKPVAKGYVPFGSGQRGVPNSLNAYNQKTSRKAREKD